MLCWGEESATLNPESVNMKKKYICAHSDACVDIIAAMISLGVTLDLDEVQLARAIRISTTLSAH